MEDDLFKLQPLCFKNKSGPGLGFLCSNFQASNNISFGAPVDPSSSSKLDYCNVRTVYKPDIAGLLFSPLGNTFRLISEVLESFSIPNPCLNH
ncbi:hypothetical protein E4U17_005947 [Claviceps sp. LM77 group G4]|nr:hypothetical protein E4U17_005947 [Claviceps sp. LM77 group G4]KAG6078662.1 hypothetical protein E4U16_001532 [Claviceps sp. LM84 group G4]